MKRTNPNFLNGVPELVLLRLLAEREMYGYEIVKAIQARTQKTFSFGEGCIYPLLHHLEQTRLVSSRRKSVEGRSRNYYRLTSSGERRLDELSSEWRRVAGGVALMMEPSNA